VTEERNPSPAVTSPWRRRSRDGVVLAAICYVCFVNTLRNPFIDYDDERGIRTNAHVHGLSWENARHALSFPEPGEWRRAYLPLRDLSIALDYSLWNWRTGGRGDGDGVARQLHQTNLVMHTANSILVYLLFVQMGLSPTVALFAAALFAGHPVHVESVSWASGRKDVLSGLLFLCALLVYLRDRSSPRLSRALALAFYLLAGLSKATTVVLPALLVAADLLLRSQGPGRQKTMREVVQARGKHWAPFFVTGLALCVLHTLMAVSGDTIHPGARNASSGLLGVLPAGAHYLWKFLFPAHLSLRYPDSPAVLALPVLLGCAALAAALVAAIRAARASSPVPLLMLVWCLLCLLPVSGILPTSTFVADRYFYLPSLGACGLLALGLSRGLKEGPVRRVILAALVLCLMALTIERNTQWAQPEALWKDALKSAPDHPVVHYNLAHAYLERGAYDHARSLLEKAHQERPDLPDVSINLAVALLETGGPGRAEALCRSVLEKEPDHVQAKLNLAVAEIAQCRIESGEALLGEVLKRSPDSPAALVVLGRVYAAKRLLPESIRSLEKALAVNPRSFEARKQLGETCFRAGKLPEAAAAYEQVLQLRPHAIGARKRLGEIYFSLGNYDYSLIHYQYVANAQPNTAENHYRLGTAFRQLGRETDAIRSWQRALEIDPEHAGARDALRELMPVRKSLP